MIFDDKDQWTEPMPQEDDEFELPSFDPNRLVVVSGEELSDMRLDPIRFCVEGLLPEGLAILGGASKVGKSWLALDLGIRVARGLPLWNIPTNRGDVLYLCLEDSLIRVQSRQNRVTEDPPENLYFAITAGTLDGNLLEQIRKFKDEHPALSLVMVDTFQLVRGGGTEISYAGDYQDMQQLKALAVELRIALLLVHHVRKMKDEDPLKEISGTMGITGGADTTFVLKRDHRISFEGKLICSGRDIEQRVFHLVFDTESCRWECLSDSLEQPETKLPRELELFVRFMRELGSFRGSNTELAEGFSAYAKCVFTAKGLKQQMNRWRYELEDCGVSFTSSRNNGVRMVRVEYRPPEDQEEDDSEEELL